MNRDILQVLLLSSLVQLASFGKAILIAYYFGVGALLDGYYLAQAVPAMCAGVLVGFFQTGFAPLYSAHLARKEGDEAASLLGGALILAAGIGLAVSIAISMLAPTLVGALVGAQGEVIAAPAVTALRALAFLLLLNAVVDCVGLALNAHHRYVATTSAPIVNALSATAILAAAPGWGLMNLIAGTLVGLLLQLILILIAAHRAGIRLVWGRYDQVAKTISAGAGIVPGVAFSNLALLLPSTFAARLGEGAVSAFSIASRLHGALTQVLAIALSTVLLPHFAHAMASNEARRVADWLRDAFPAICAVGIVLVLWVGLAGPGVVALIFERGSFDSAATTSVASVWLWLTVGLVPSVWGIALAKLLQAMQLGGLLSWTAALSIASLFGFSAIGVALNSLNVIAYAAALAASVSVVAFASIAGRRLTQAGVPATPVPTGLAAFIATTAIAVAIGSPTAYFKTPLAAALATLILVVIVILVAIKYLARQRRCRSG